MAHKVFEIRTEPHTAEIGGTELYFEAEVIGSVFATAYDALRSVQQKVNAAQGGKASSTKHAKADQVDSSTLAELSDAMRDFVRRFLLPESVDAFDAMRLPDRVLVELLEWVAELYGGGSGKADATGTSSA